MFWTIVATLSVLWAVGVISAQTLGGFIHLLLVMALLMVIIRLVQGRKIVN